jgi:hypothetical protein
MRIYGSHELEVILESIRDVVNIAAI